MKRSRVGRREAIAGLLAAALLGAPAPATEPAAEGEIPSASQVLAEALENLHPTRHERVELVNYKGGRRGFKRRLELSVLRQDGVFRVLGTFTHPGEVRGTAFLILPPSKPLAADESVPPNDYYLYVPALSKIKRISGAQRADSFFGTRLSQGDVEPHPADHYRARGVRAAMHENEPVYLVDAEPLFEAGYARIRFTIARKDRVILKMQQYRSDDELPIRTIETRREWVEQLGDHALPTRLIVLDGKGRRFTEVTFADRRLVAAIPASRFSLSHLQRRGD